MPSRGDSPAPDKVTIALTDSKDVAGSIGRAGFLTRRLRASNQNAPDVDILLIEGARCDVLAQRLTVPDDHDVPAHLAPGLSASLDPIELPDTTVLLVLSMSEVLTGEVVRHRNTGHLLQLPPGAPDNWSDEDRDWLTSCYEPAPPDAADLENAIATIERELAERNAAFATFNVSTFTPDEKVYWFRPGDPEPLALTANRVDLMLDALPKESRIAVVDIDRLVAELGAGDAVTSPGRYTEAASEHIAEEAATLIVDLPGISELFTADTMRLAIPRYDRRTEEGVLLRWHVAAHNEIKAGDPLFDVRFDHLHTRVNAAVKRQSDRSLHVSVVATRDGYLKATTLDEGEPVAVGATVGVVTRGPEIGDVPLDDVASFPVGVKVVTQ